MKKIISLTFILCIFFSSSLFAARIDNRDQMFVDQPCFGLDNKNPSGSGFVIYTDGYVGDRQVYNRNSQTVEDNSNAIKCRIYQTVFNTNITLSNFVPCGKGFLIKFHYTHDGNDYYLKYDEKDKLYRPYTPDELALEIARLNSN